MNKLLIDTNIYSSMFRGDSEVVLRLKHVSHIGITSISIGELLSGFKAGTREEVNRRELEEFLDTPRVALYGVDADTAEFYSAILNQLRMQGTPIPTNDIWIAAVAFQHGLELYTRDQHFTKIQGLLLSS